jgi:hypothetical protein
LSEAKSGNTGEGCTVKIAMSPPDFALLNPGYGPGSRMIERRENFAPLACGMTGIAARA